MIGRIIWIAALLGLALLTIGLQFDKQSERNPELAPLVPEALRNFAQTKIAARAAAGTDPAAALRETERLIRRRPIPAEYLTLRAVAQGKAGKAEEAGLAIQIAGQRGWRDPIAQEAVLRLALDAGDQAEAARRYAALLLRKGTTDALLLELGPMVLNDAGGVGRKTLVDIVVAGERWHPVFMRRGAVALPPEAFAAVISASIRRGVTFDCTTLGQSVAVLAQRDAVAADAIATAAATSCPKLAASGG